MTIVGISHQILWLRKTLRGLASGKAIETLAPCKPRGDKAPMPPLIPRCGNTFLMIPIAGGRRARMMKGRDRLIASDRKLPGQA